MKSNIMFNKIVIKVIKYLDISFSRLADPILQIIQHHLFFLLKLLLTLGQPGFLFLV